MMVDGEGLIGKAFDIKTKLRDCHLHISKAEFFVVFNDLPRFFTHRSALPARAIRIRAAGAAFGPRRGRYILRSERELARPGLYFEDFGPWVGFAAADAIGAPFSPPRSRDSHPRCRSCARPSPRYVCTAIGT